MTTRSMRAATALSPRSLGYITSATLALLLGGCSQSADLLPSLNVQPTENASNDKAPAAQNELQKATVYWGQEYAKKPAELQPALNYARNLKAMGEKRKSMAVLQQASLLHDDSKELAGEYGRLALDLDQVGIASQALAMADDPTMPDWKIISARGTVLAKQGKYGDAIPYYERALTLSDKNPTVMNNLAMAYAMMGDAKKAEGILRDAANSDKATAKVKENLALVLGLQGRYDESKSIAAAAAATGGADVDYLKQMVKAPAFTEDPAQGWVTTASAPTSAGGKQAAKQGGGSKTPEQIATTVWKTSVTTPATPSPAKFKSAQTN